MSNNKDGSIAPKERINIRYVPKTDGQVAEVELPLNLLVTGDLSGKPDQTPLDERQPVAIDRNNFNAVIAQSNVGRNFTVPSALNGNDGARMDINLKVNSMADLSPDSIASQVPELKKLLVCTNRMLPTELHTGDIKTAVGKNPAVASFSNITRPTRPFYPVTDGDMQWSLISSMNLNYLSLLDRDALVQILRTFDIPGIHHPQQARLSQQKLDAIEKMETQPVDRLFKGVPVRGLATTLWINPAPFVCEGEVYLLGTVLSHFFALYASINSFHRLKIINTESQEVWEWKSTGQHALM